ncbi:MAG: glycosyl hydrolase family 18 protein [Tumebacillaceae bacterium]
MEGSRVTYIVVQPGDTVADLAARYNMSHDDLARLNRGLQGVAAGDVIKVAEQEPDFRMPRVRTHFVLGFYTGPMGVNMPGSQSSFARQSALLSAIAPYWFDLDAKAPGNIKPRVTPTQIRELVADAHRRNVKILASIHNTDRVSGVSRVELAHSVMTAHRMTFFRNLFALLSEYGFDGVNLDIEHLSEGDRGLYTEFVRDLTERAHRQGKLVTVDVLGDARKEPYSLDFDYPGLSAAVNYLGIMTYDQFKPSEAAPGPVASLPWVEETLQRALQEGVPPEKILLGIPAYGYDWTVGQPGARALSYEAVERLRNQHKSVVSFHPTFKVPHLTYADGKGQQHEVWYENARSISLKLDLVRKYGLGGIIFWRLGLEDPAAWGVLRAKLSPIE